MISVETATEQIMQNIDPFSVTSCKLSQAKNRVLTQPLIADRGHPPFDRVAMDGIAVSNKNVKGPWDIQGCQGAGAATMKLIDDSKCIEIMTGAKLPENCDLIIPYENIEIKDGLAACKVEISLDKSNIHKKDTDYLKGDVLVKRGSLLRSPELAIAATIGLAEPQVFALPRVAIISTGDELVSVDQTPSEVQIRQSNVYAVGAQLSSIVGAENIDNFHFNDDREVLFEKLAGILQQYDWIVLSGGVSMGRYDFVPKVLSDLKVKEIFHRVRQRPGKPLWFGKGPSGQHVFGLPGNPISTTISCRRYVIPALLKAQGLKEKPLWARLSQPISFAPQMAKFQPVQINCDEQGVFRATPINMNGSGDLASLAKTDGFIQLPSEPGEFLVDQVFRTYLWESIL